MPKKRPKNTLRKNEIIEAALNVISEKDYQEATISEITKKVGISEATMYEYFRSKEDLFFAIPDKITSEALRLVEEILPFIRGAESKIRAIVQVYLTVCQNNPEYTSLVMLHLKTNKKFRSTEAYETIRNGARLLLGCIQEGIDEGTFRQDADPYVLRALLLGAIEHLTTRWRMLGTPEDLVGYADSIVEVVMHGAMRRDCS